MEVPMLDEEEFSKIEKLYREAFSKKGLPIDDRFQQMRETYHAITGYFESNQNAIMHHRISIFGPPCNNCGKPLRTPEAAFCAACGVVVSN